MGDVMPLEPTTPAQAAELADALDRAGEALGRLADLCRAAATYREPALPMGLGRCPRCREIMVPSRAGDWCWHCGLGA